MKALQQSSSPESNFIINESEIADLSKSILNRAKTRILEHVRNGTDVILVTSAKHNSEPISLESYFSDNNQEIRTICLNQDSFGPQDDQQPVDLSMISAVVYESIHLDSHFAIIVDSADQISIQALNELIKLALGINSSKNNVNFIFSGGPGLLGMVEQISDITRLSLAHCSVDVLTEEDIQEFIDIKQSCTDNALKLHFNKYVLKKICTFANGSLHSASVLLEWIRLYALNKDKNKITVALLDELKGTLEDASLLSNYPPKDYQFLSDSTSELPNYEENVEFVKHEAITHDEQAIVSESNTIYIENVQQDADSKLDASNVYEKVMHEPEDVGIEDHQSINENVDDSFDAHDDIQVEIDAVAIAIDSSEVIDKISLTTNEAEYTDTYHLDALKNINDPFSLDNSDLRIDKDEQAPAQLIQTNKKTHSNKLFFYLLLIVVVISGGLYAWSNNYIDHSLFDAFSPKVFSTSNALSHRDALNKTDYKIHNETLVTGNDIENNKPLTSDSGIESLITLAHQQIDDKKLTTPDGDNAYETFRLILEFEPNNRQALAGIDKIKNRYASWAKLDIKDGNIKRAKYFLSLAVEIDPKDRELKQILTGINQPSTLAN